MCTKFTTNNCEFSSIVGLVRAAALLITLLFTLWTSESVCQQNMTSYTRATHKTRRARTDTGSDVFKHNLRETYSACLVSPLDTVDVESTSPSDVITEFWFVDHLIKYDSIRAIIMYLVIKLLLKFFWKITLVLIVIFQNLCNSNTRIVFK